MGLANKKCVPCEGGVEKLGAEEARKLLKDIPGWAISEDGKWIKKSFKFGDFAAALAFVGKVGAIAEDEGHHPDIELGWGYSNIRLQTHAVGGLHENDFIVASKIEKIQ